MQYLKVRGRAVMVAVAAFLILLILTTGTFAWQSVSQQALNQAIGAPGPAGGRLHHRFQVMGPNYGEQEGATVGQAQWRAGMTADKAVYIENFERIANNGRDIFLRVRLYEYMEIGQGARLHPGELGFDDREAVSVIQGADREDFTTWTVRVPGDDPDGSNYFRQFWDWGMGGQTYFIPTFNRDPYSRETDIKGNAFDPQALQTGETRSSTHRGMSHAYPLEAGLSSFFTAERYHYGLVKSWDASLNLGIGGHAIATYATRHDAKLSLHASVITMDYWINQLNSQPGNFWVWDEDGWFYWAMPLAAEDATGLIINSVGLRQNPSAQWFYAIFVDAEMAIANEWHAGAAGLGWFHNPERAPSSNATELLTRITGVIPPAIQG